MRPGREVVDEIQEGGLAPVDVVEDEHERTPPGESLDERSDGPERLLGAARLLNEADHLAKTTGGDLGFLIAVEHVAESSQVLRVGGRVVEVRCVADRLEHGPVCDSLAVRQTAPTRDEGGLAQVRHELLHKTRLPDACGTENREELARAVARRLLEGVVQAPPLASAPDHGRVEAAHLAHCGPHAEQPNVIPLKLRGDHVANEAVRELVQQDCTRGRGMLQAKRLGHGSPGRVRCVPVPAGKHLARPDADAHVERRPPLRDELLLQRCKSLPHLGRSRHGSKGVVLVHGRNSEDGCYDPAERTLDRCGPALERRKERVEPPRGHPPKRLGIELGAGGDEITGEAVTVLRTSRATGTGAGGTSTGASAAGVVPKSVSEGSCARIACCSSLSSRPGSSPSSSARTARPDMYTSSASAWRPERYSASMSCPRRCSRRGCARTSPSSSPTTSA